MAQRTPNIVVLMTDHQRADSIGMRQAALEVTPNLNRLAAESARFTRAYNACPLCVPARTALFTGRYPTRNGVVFNDWRGERAGDHAPLMQHLAEAGYDVAHVGVDHIRVRPGHRERVDYALYVGEADHRDYLRERGLDGAPPGGPDRFRVPIAERVGDARRECLYSNARTGVWPHASEHFRDVYWARRAEEFVRSRAGGQRPFALFLFLWAPHPPLVVPQPYASLFAPEELDLPPNVGAVPEREPGDRRSGIAAQMAEGVDEAGWRRAWAGHLGLVHLADAALGGVLDALDAAGARDETLVVFTVDHGDHLGQHRMYQKMEMYEPAVRVPLLVRAPGARPATSATPVSHLDVMPTVMELVGLPTPDGMDGVSLADTVLRGAPPPERPVFGQYSGNPAVGDIRRAVVSGRHKYVWDPESEPELYDLDADPLEMDNRAGEPALAGVRRELHEACARWHRAHGDWVSYDAG